MTCKEYLKIRVSKNNAAAGQLSDEELGISFTENVPQSEKLRQTCKGPDFMNTLPCHFHSYRLPEFLALFES